MQRTLHRNAAFLAACTAALLLFAAAYSNSLRNAFHFDDAHVVEQNLFVRDVANIPRFFTDARTFSSLPQNATYRPVVSTTLAVDYWIGGGLNPLPFHITQLVLFALVGAMLVGFYRKLLDRGADVRARWVALFGAALFCLHTANTQTGNYISARSELLAALGVLGGFLVYLHFPRGRRYHLYLLPVVGGALAKNLAVMFAPLLLAYILLIEQQLSLSQMFARSSWFAVRRALISSAPAFALSAVLFVFVEAMNPPGQTYGGGGRLEYLATQAWVWLRYVGLYFVPVGLTADSDLRLFATRLDLRTLVGLLVFIGSIAAAWRASRSGALRPVAFGILWFWIALLPTSSIFPLAEVTNDHRVFLPFIGLNVAVVWWIWSRVDDLKTRATAWQREIAWGAAVAGVLVLAMHAAATLQRNRVWRSDETLWADVARKSPTNGRGLMNYGLSQMRRGRLLEAKDLFLRARQFTPNYSFLEVNLGVVNSALSDQQAAEFHFRRAVDLEPNQPVVHRHFAAWLAQQGHGPDAVWHLRRLLELTPGDAAARHALMGLYAALGAQSDLAALATETLRLASTDAVARTYATGRVPLAPERVDSNGWFLLGWSLTQAERHVEAAQAYRSSIHADPKNADAWNNLGWTLGKLGFYDAAVPALENAVALRPSYQLARNNLAWARGEIAGRRAP